MAQRKNWILQLLKNFGTVYNTRLKDTKLLLSHNCTCAGSQVAPQELLNNFDGAIENRIREITSHMRVFNQDKRPYAGGDISIVVNV